jgi:hypothetical protein
MVRLVHADAGEQIQIDLWEDEADVRHGSFHRRFKVPRTLDPAAPDGWIPDAVELVEQLLVGGAFVE